LSDERALRTCNWDKPNCRAILDGVTPALNAARTAFICPRVSGVAAVLDGRCWVGLPVGRGCFGDGSTEPGSIFVGVPGAGITLPRRPASSIAAWRSRSRSPLLRYLMAVGESLGRAGRRGRLAFTLVEGPLIPSVEKRSGVPSSMRLRLMMSILSPSSAQGNFDF
jgi:hypothetical protein